MGRTLFKERDKWVIRHQAADYKTGRSYGERPPMVIAPHVYPEVVTVADVQHTWSCRWCCRCCQRDAQPWLGLCMHAHSQIFALAGGCVGGAQAPSGILLECCAFSAREPVSLVQTFSMQVCSSLWSGSYVETLQNCGLAKSKRWRVFCSWRRSWATGGASCSPSTPSSSPSLMASPSQPFLLLCISQTLHRSCAMQMKPGNILQIPA